MIAGIVLAAGAARRMGRPKQVLPLGGGTLLGVTLARAMAALPRVVVVLGAAAEMIQAQVNLHGAEVVFAPDHAEGQAAALRAGLRVVTGWPPCDAALVLLGDQPTVRVEAIQRIADCYATTRPQPATIVPRYGDRRGHPVLFARAAWPRLLRELHGDAGARALLARGEPAPLLELALPAEWWPDDIDTWADYTRLRDAEPGAR
jgi:molybdenum cofactor cytidylyltransferase